MRIVTFAGNLTYIDEVIKKNKITDIYVDKSFYYGRDKPPENARIVDTGIPPSFFEVTNRRIRIAKMLIFVLRDINDDIFFVDSDVVIENIDNLINILSRMHYVTPLCIPALAKPLTTIIEFCYPTTFYMPRDMHDDLMDVLNYYLGSNKYVTDPVDIYIHMRMKSTPIKYPGICHYIKGEKVCLT